MFVREWNPLVMWRSGDGVPLKLNSNNGDSPKVVFLNFYGAPESTPKNRLRSSIYPGGPVRHPYSHSVPSPLRSFCNSSLIVHTTPSHTPPPPPPRSKGINKNLKIKGKNKFLSRDSQCIDYVVVRLTHSGKIQNYWLEREMKKIINFCIVIGEPVLEFLNNLWGLGTE
jgi:hypothetical protein